MPEVRDGSLASCVMEPLDLPRLRIEIPEDGWGTERDLVYHAAEGRALHLDRYFPSAGPERGTVIVLHGEPALEEGDRWWGEDRAVKDCQPLRDWGALLASSGLATFVANHRCSEGFTRPDLVDDDLDAIIRFIGGGAHAWFAFSGSVPFAIKRSVGDRRVRALVTMYGPLDLDEPELCAWFPGLEHARARERSPLHLTTRTGWPPHLHVWPEQDWLPNGVESFAGAATEAALPFELLTHPSGGHGFDFLADDDHTRALIASIIAFLHRPQTV